MDPIDRRYQRALGIPEPGPVPLGAAGDTALEPRDPSEVAEEFLRWPEERSRSGPVRSP